MRSRDLIRDFDAFIKASPDPVGTQSRVQRLIDHPPAAHYLSRLSLEKRKDLVSILNISHFICHQIILQPEILNELGQPSAPLDADVEKMLTIDELRAYKYRELFKIAWMEISCEDYLKILEALTSLAEVIIRKALQICLSDTEYALVKQTACVIAMGKLGAGELNLSSDVDLIIVSINPGQYEGDFKELQKRLFDSVRTVANALEQKTASGFLYRVDLKLRPWGDSGPLVVTQDHMQEYYASSARSWERFAWLRARPIAGALEAGEQLMAAIKPQIFRRVLTDDDLRRFVEIKNQMQRTRNRKGRWNVKVGEGGIRDIEFFVQMLQLVNGAEHPKLQTTNTINAIYALADADLIQKNEADDIAESYLFLRRLENRLQLLEELQVHDLPDDDASRLYLARSLMSSIQDQRNYLEAFNSQLHLHQSQAKRYFDRILPSEAVRTYDEELESLVNKAWHVKTAGVSTQRWLDVCRSESWGNIPNNIFTLISIFGASWYFSRYIFFRGYDAADLIDSAHSLKLDRNFFQQVIRANDTRGDLEHRLERLRRSKNDCMLQVLIQFLDGYINQAQTETALTVLAQVTFNTLLDIFGMTAFKEKGSISVLGMGRMAGDEMTFGSDLDLIFLYDTDSTEEYESITRKVKQLMRSLSGISSYGALYDVDMRLRPHGTSGALITSTDSFIDYHSQPRESWERQMMTRCCVIMDEDRLGERTLGEIEPAVFQKYDDRKLKEDIYTMRLRVEREKGSEKGKCNVKQGTGGLMDIDFLSHYFQLTHAHQDPLLKTGSTRAVIQLLQQSDKLTEDHASELLNSYDFLKRIEACVRLFDMKAVSAFPEEGALIHALSRASAYDDIDDFRDTCKTITQGVRKIFDHHLRPSP